MGRDAGALGGRRVGREVARATPLLLALGTLAALAAVFALRSVPGTGSPAGGAPGDAARPPNLVLIVGDDVGWTDHGFMGSPSVKTPNLDRLAAGGTVFTRAFSTSSVCRPSLHTLLTGLYPEAIDDRFHRQRQRRPGPLRTLVPTLPARLAERGYASFQGGKHWEGTFADAGFTDGMTRTRAAPSEDRGRADPGALSGREGLALGRETMEPLFAFLEAHRGAPFFVLYAPMLPHQPFDAPSEYVALYADEPRPAARAYYANVTRFDATVGALVDRLRELGLADDTLVVYVADNGWDTEGPQTVRGGDRGKGTVHEIGFRTPMIVAWPGRVAAGVRDDRIVSLVDVYPTLLDFAGAAPGAVPGKSLHPLLVASGGFDRRFALGVSGRRRERALFLRSDAWRYVTTTDGDALYAIEEDPREERDVSARHPEIVASLRAELARQLEAAQRPRRRR